MPAGNEIARLKRDIETLTQAVNTDLRPGSRSPMTASERRALKSEIQACMQALDELGTRLSG
ncbi:MAG: hypothetical protein ABIO40_02925 [Devosia sp.]